MRRAHNTVVLDDRDQSESAGPFLWTSSARATLLRWEELQNGAVLAASHDGYTRLDDPVWHERTLRLEGLELRVQDLLRGAAAHTVEWRLHSAPHCTVEIDGSLCRIQGRVYGLLVVLDEALTWELVSADSRGGWCSRGFNRRESATTLIGRGVLPLPAALTHTITVIE